MPADPGDQAFIVTTDDGRMFQCSVESIADTQQPRWIFIDTNQVRYVGPPWPGVTLEPELRRLVNDWWREKKALGQEA